MNYIEIFKLILNMQLVSTKIANDAVYVFVDSTNAPEGGGR